MHSRISEFKVKQLLFKVMFKVKQLFTKNDLRLLLYNTLFLVILTALRLTSNVNQKAIRSSEQFLTIL